MLRSILFGAGLSLLLVGCGGGGDSPSTPAPAPSAPSPPPSPPPPAGPPSVTFSATTISRTAATVDAAPVDESITFATSDGSNSYWYLFNSTVGLIDEAVVFRTSTGGKLSLRLAKPARLGAGTYTASFTLTLCADEQCAVKLPGTPQTITLTYVVTGNPQPNSGVTWHTELYPTELQTSDTQQLTITVRIEVQEVPPDGLYLFHTPSQTGLISSMSFEVTDPASPIPSGYGTYTVKLKAPAALGSGFFTDSIAFKVCLDVDCAFELTDARFELRPDITVFATDGAEFALRMREPANGAQALGWSDAQQRLYVLSSVHTLIGGQPAEVLALDPATLNTTSSLNLGSAPLQLLAVASDGQGLFVTARSGHAVRHLQLPGLVQDYSIDLGVTPAPSLQPLYVQDLLPVAGAPQSVVLSLQYDNRAGGIFVYDGVTPRVDSIPAYQVVSLPRWITQGDTPAKLYSARYDPSQPSELTIDRLALSPSGLTRAAATPVNVFMGPLQYANGLVHNLQGEVRDPATGSVIRKLTLPSAYVLGDYVVDAAHNRLFAVAVRNGDNRRYLFSYELDTLRFLAIAKMFDPQGATHFDGFEDHVILWGTEGFAYSDGEKLVVMSGPFFTTYDGGPTVSPTH